VQIRRALARYKLPRQLHIFESISRNSTGKVQKFVLKQQLINAATR
jgi:acyl-CoA synthetase (AMP-forming)/AMP-acid ligase II